MAFVWELLNTQFSFFFSLVIFLSLAGVLLWALSPLKPNYRLLVNWTTWQYKYNTVPTKYKYKYNTVPTKYKYKYNIIPIKIQQQNFNHIVVSKTGPKIQQQNYRLVVTWAIWQTNCTYWIFMTLHLPTSVFISNKEIYWGHKYFQSLIVQNQEPWPARVINSHVFLWSFFLRLV